MKKLLLTTNQIKGYTGAEINALELSKEFLHKGYDVELACFESGLPLLKEFEKLNIPVFHITKSLSLKNKNYDLIWAHHSMTLTTLLLKSDVDFKRIIFSSLSPYIYHEIPPFYANNLTYCLANSQETREMLLNHKVNDENVIIFENAAPRDFFNYKKNKQNNGLKNILVVSNHVPQEIKALNSISRGINFSYIGREYKAELITPELLSEYDAVITIGKTCQYAFAMEIPVYCYDRFGGPGWITPCNFSKAKSFNFSGRCCNKRLTSDKIYEALTNGWGAVFENTTNFKELAIAHFHLGKKLTELLNKIDNKPTIENTSFVNNSYYRQINNIYLIINKLKYKLLYSRPKAKKQNRETFVKKIGRQLLCKIFKFIV